MARTSLAAAKAELFGLLSSGSQRASVAGITSAFDHDPGPGRLAGPISLVLTTAGIDPDFFIFALRLYADAGSDPRRAHQSLDLVMPAITAKLDARWGEERWVGPSPHPDRDDVLVCEWVVSCGREDQ